MVKIKRKVEMTHEEYAKYMIDKFGIASYERELIDNNIFDAPMEFEQTFTLKSMRKDDDPVIEHSFKGVVIEVGEEINRETELNLVERYVFVGEENNPKYMTHHPRSLNSILESNPSEVRTTHFYTEVNDDLVLIWRDGKLVE